MVPGGIVLVDDGTHVAGKIKEVTSGEIVVDKENWGKIGDWNEQYDNAIGNLLAAHKSEEALTAL